MDTYRLTTNDGKVFEGEPKEIIGQLAEMDHETCNPAEYVKAVKRRHLEATGEEIRTPANYKDFLQALADRFGLVKTFEQIGEDE